MSERKTVHKWFWAWEFDKEEQWLNLMANSGWVLDGVGYATYHFIPCAPGEYTIGLEMRDHDDAYLHFMAETGAEYVGRMVKWIYFRKKAEHGAFTIFSDLESRITHLNKIGQLLSIFTWLNLGIGLINSVSPAHLGWINLLCAALLSYGLGRIHGKKEALEKDRMLLE